MLQYTRFCFLSSFIITSLARIHITSPYTFEIDQCKDICSDSFFLLPLGQDSQNICQRGCRFFNLIDIKAERNLNDTNRECHVSCEESYVNAKAQGSCTVGCDTMSKKKESDLHKYFPYLDQYTTDEQEFDSLEADILLDPLIRKQVQSGNLQYKIPEAYIRTMPIDSDDLDVMEANNIHFKQYEDDYYCTSVIPFAFFLLLLFAVFTCTLKITWLVYTIKYQLAANARNKALQNGTKEENKGLVENDEHNLKDVPEVAIVIPEKESAGDAATKENLIDVNK